MPQVEPLPPGRAGEAGRVLGPAFADDPVWAWLLRGEHRVRRLGRVLGAYAAAAAEEPGGQVLLARDADGRPVGASVWRPPGRWRAAPRPGLRRSLAAARALGPAGSLRGLRTELAFERAHPHEPHWYLEVLGVVPAAQGTGTGGPLLQPVLDRCDAEGLPAYLESSNPRNWSFYARHGFVGGTPLDLPAGCPVVLPMRRAPR